jgi:hypothetical protein
MIRGVDHSVVGNDPVFISMRMRTFGLNPALQEIYNRVEKHAVLMMASAGVKAMRDLSLEDIVTYRKTMHETYKKAQPDRKAMTIREDDRLIDRIIEGIFLEYPDRWDVLEDLPYLRRVSVVGLALTQNPVILGYLNASVSTNAKMAGRIALARMALTLQNTTFVNANSVSLVADLTKAEHVMAEQGYSKRSIKTAQTRSRGLLTWAFRLGYRDDDPFGTRRRVSDKKVDTTPLKATWERHGRYARAARTPNQAKFEWLSDREPFLMDYVMRCRPDARSRTYINIVAISEKFGHTLWRDLAEADIVSLEAKLWNDVEKDPTKYGRYQTLMILTSSITKYARERHILKKDPAFLFVLPESKKRGWFVILDEVTPLDRTEQYDSSRLVEKHPRYVPREKKLSLKARRAAINANETYAP